MRGGVEGRRGERHMGDLCTFCTILLSILNNKVLSLKMVSKARTLGKMAKSREIQRPRGLHLRGRGGGGGTSTCDRRKTRRARYPGSQRKKVFEKEWGLPGPARTAGHIRRRQNPLLGPPREKSL